MTADLRTGAGSLRAFLLALLILPLIAIPPRMARAAELAQWIPLQATVSTAKLLANISPAGAVPGVVLASPSRENPNYYFHWIRDAGLTMEVVFSLYERSGTKSQKARYKQLLQDFVAFSRMNQLSNTPSGGPGTGGLGEPKFHVDGTPFTGSWGRPQNDGPAIRASALIRFAHRLLDQGAETYVRSRLYDGRIPSESVIKADLEFVAHHWREPSFDLWEETRGQHFYTRMVQRRALLSGAELADRLGDPGAGYFYRAQARELEKAIASHWDENSRILRATLEGGENKPSNLDSAILLGVLHGSMNDGFFGPSDDRVLSTVERLRESFKGMYSINSIAKDAQGRRLGVAMGRYPEDRYSGSDIPGPANPWFLITNGLAELDYRLAQQLLRQKNVIITYRSERFYRSLGLPNPKWATAGQTHSAGSPAFEAILDALQAAGDAQLRRTQYHAPEDGALSEQMNRETGFSWGAFDLTWSHASFLSAIWNR
jgi:glucoamylase